MEDKEKKAVTTPTNIRLTPEVMEEFRKISAQFSSQNSALETLIELFKKDEVLQAIPQYAKKLEEFNQYINIAAKRYTDVLIDLSTAEHRAQEDISGILGEKDSNIMLLQAEVSRLRNDSENYQKQFIEIDKQRADLLEKNESLKESARKRELDIAMQMETHKSAIKDKEQINGILGNRIAELDLEVKKSEDYPKRLAEVQTRVSDLEEALKAANASLKEEQHKAKIDRMEAIRQTEDNMRIEIENLKAAAQDLERQNMSEIIVLRKEQAAEIKELHKQFEEKEAALRSKYEK